jgi:hypothetical protein
MDVRYTAEQHALRDSAKQMVSRLGPSAVGELDDIERSTKLDAAIDGTGWRELRNSDGSGAPWATAVEACLVAEELARGLADAPFLGPTLAAELRRLAGAPEASGRETVSLTPDLSGLAAPASAAVAIDAGGSTSALAFAEGALWVVGLDGPSVAVDLTRPSVALPPHPGDRIAALSIDDLTRWSALALALTAADLVGTMQGALDLSTAYAADRKQYGAPIGSFQAVAHMLAEALVHLEGSRTALLHAGWSVDALDPADALAAAAAAKAYASRAAREVCEIAIQVHGGIGNTWECLAHVHLRRSLLATDVLGGVGPNLDRVLAHAQIGA